VKKWKYCFFSEALLYTSRGNFFGGLSSLLSDSSIAEDIMDAEANFLSCIAKTLAVDALCHPWRSQSLDKANGERDFGVCNRSFC
jgi:hypothetical protein